MPSFGRCGWSEASLVVSNMRMDQSGWNTLKYIETHCIGGKNEHMKYYMKLRWDMWNIINLRWMNWRTSLNMNMNKSQVFRCLNWVPRFCWFIATLFNLTWDDDLEINPQTDWIVNSFFSDGLKVATGPSMWRIVYSWFNVGSENSHDLANLWFV